MGHVTLTIDEYLDLLDDARKLHRSGKEVLSRGRSLSKKAKKLGKKTPRSMPKGGYHARYGKAFKSLSSKFKKKNGSWKKNGFKRCAAAARKVAKK